MQAVLSGGLVFLAVLAERWFGGGRGLDDYVVLGPRSGFGVAIVQGQPYAPNTAAGEARTVAHQAFAQFPPQRFYEMSQQEGFVNVTPPALDELERCLALPGMKGVKVHFGNGGISLRPSSLGNTTQNYIGDSQWTADPALLGSIDDFRIHGRAFSQAEIQALSGGAVSGRYEAEVREAFDDEWRSLEELPPSMERSWTRATRSA